MLSLEYSISGVFIIEINSLDSIESDLIHDSELVRMVKEFDQTSTDRGFKSFASMNFLSWFTPPPPHSSMPPQDYQIRPEVSESRMELRMCSSGMTSDIF